MRKQESPKEKFFHFIRAQIIPTLLTKKSLTKRQFNNLTAQALRKTREGNHLEAEKIYRYLIEKEAATYSIYGELAASCGMQGNMDELEFYSRKALELNRNYPMAHNNLGFALQSRGDLDNAIKAYEMAINIKPDYSDAYFNLGNAKHKSGNLTEAIKSYKTAIKLKPSESRYSISLGKVLQESNNQQEAAKIYAEAIEANPQHTDLYIELGNLLAKNEDLAKADKLYQAALKFNPNDTRSLFFIGNLLKKQEDFHGAVVYYKKVLELSPKSAEAHMNLGNTYQDLGQYELAMGSYASSLAINPNSSDAYYNLGIAQNKSGNHEEAIRSYKNAIRLNESPQYLHSLAHVMLIQGDYKNGLELYESRMNLTEKDYHIEKFIESTKHNRTNNLDHRNLLVVSEQGLGDTLHFMRYLQTLKQIGIQYKFCAQPKLHSLIQHSGLDPNPLSIQQASKLEDLNWIPLLSLLKCLEVSPNRILIKNPYIKTDKNLDSKWKTIFSKTNKQIIGINWKGNRRDSRKKERNIDIAQLKQLVETLDATFVSLQRGAIDSEMPAWLKQKFTEQQSEIHKLANSNDSDDFLEYASIVANCDLVITTATTVAHLSAGMGKPTWIMLQKVPDWRWGLYGNQTPWYPSARLFRQTTHEDWTNVVAEMSYELNQIATSNR